MATGYIVVAQENLTTVTVNVFRSYVACYCCFVINSLFNLNVIL